MRTVRVTRQVEQQPRTTVLKCGGMTPPTCSLAWWQAPTGARQDKAEGRVRKRDMKVEHIELRDANAFVLKYHRHHKPVVGHRFSIAAVTTEGIVGVVIVGRPVARHANQHTTVEVTRLCTDGTANACSFLYAAAARAAKALGYKRIQTFILDNETGVTLKASGWSYELTNNGGQWKHSHHPHANRTDQPTNPKQRWAKDLT